MQDISLHVLDIVDNSIRAGATEVHIYIEEDPDRDLLRVEISDNGEGMDAEMMKNAVDPVFYFKKRKTGRTRTASAGTGGPRGGR